MYLNLQHNLFFLLIASLNHYPLYLPKVRVRLPRPHLWDFTGCVVCLCCITEPFGFCLSHVHFREVKIKFPMSSGRPNVPENYYETEIRLKELQWKRARFVDDLQREQTLLDHAKFNFEIKKQDFVKFLARSSSYASAVIFCVSS